MVDKIEENKQKLESLSVDLKRVQSAREQSSEDSEPFNAGHNFRNGQGTESPSGRPARNVDKLELFKVSADIEAGDFLTTIRERQKLREFLRVEHAEHLLPTLEQYAKVRNVN
jgi:hypothetical protein